MSDTDNDSEYVVTTATYKGFLITCTSWGNYTVLIYTTPYPAMGSFAHTRAILISVKSG